jgi:sodium/proline symporter
MVSLTFAAYLLLVFMIGLYAYRLTNSEADYFLGGRNLSPWVAALSAGASDMSGWLLIGLPGYAYVSGLEAVWIAVGLTAGVAASWTLLAKRLRIYSFELDNALTIPTYLQRRFEDHSPLLRTVAALFILIFFLFYVSSGLIAGAKLFNAVFELPYTWAVLVGAAAIISYTLFGGFLAVSWTDVLQGLLMTLALIAVPWVLFDMMNGWVGIGERISDKNSHLLSIWTNKDGQELGFVAILSLLGWGLGYFGQPHILARFKAVRSHKDIATASTIAVLWTLVVFVASLAVGLSGAAWIAEPLPDAEKVFIVLVDLLFHPLVAGVMLAGILAAIMSTADSQLLVCSSALAEDLAKQWLKRPLTEAQVLLIGRAAVVGLALLATLIAMDPNSSVLDVVAYAWAGLGATFGPVILISVYWPRMNKPGALAGLLSGGLTVLCWKQLEGGWFDLYELVPGFVIACVAIVGVSLLTAEPSKRLRETFVRVVKT